LDAAQIVPGLWRWTAPHPAWEPGAEPESVGDWPEEVGSVLFESREGLAVFVDPQLPRDPEPFWAWADAHVGERPVHVVSTVRWHERSRDALAARYAAADEAPGDVELLPFPRLGETIVWLPEQQALVPGDRIIGAPGGALRLCPQSWLGFGPERPTVDEMRGLLRPLADLPVERVLVSHGEPVLAGAREALRSALSAGT
jgi:hypothetical protein